MAGHEIRLGNQVGGVNRLGAKAQVGNRDRAGFLGVVDEVTLRVVVRIFTDDLDGVLVGAHGAVGTQSVEDGAHGLGIFGRERGVNFQAGVGDVVHDAHHEVVARRGLQHFVEHRLHHRGGEFLGRQSVAPADDAGEAWRTALCPWPCPSLRAVMTSM